MQSGRLERVVAQQGHIVPGSSAGGVASVETSLPRWLDQPGTTSTLMTASNEAVTDDRRYCEEDGDEDPRRAGLGEASIRPGTAANT